MLGVRIECTVRTETVVEGRELVSRQDLLRLDGLYVNLGGAFDRHIMTWDNFLNECRFRITNLANIIHIRDARGPSLKIRSALTFARQAIGWSGKYMPEQLRDAREWKVGIERRANESRATERRANEVRANEHHDFEQHQETRELYEDDILDPPNLRPLIFDFLSNAKWFIHYKIKDKSVEGLMLKNHQHQYMKKGNIYLDRIGAARHYTNEFGRNWRNYIQFDR
jgi:hypothetical protein